MNIKLVESLVQAIESLSSEEQNLLKARLSHAESRSTSVQPDWQTDPFIGMWSDRPEMSDSNEWVRTLRQQEWST